MFESECTSNLSKVDSEVAKTLRGIIRGVEKEGLRVSENNSIAQTSHPKVLGSTLTHPSITTDYSEALLEFITPTHENVSDTVNYLADLHVFTQENIGEELIWPASMPCRLDGDKSVPIANYGTSNVGQLKHVYRQGLGIRYGRLMQSIAGIHYNFSLPDEFWAFYKDKLEVGDEQSLQDFKSAHYFSLIRNFRRYSWILHYLFGASPVLDKSFLGDRTDHGLERLLGCTYGLPYATSLRMSDLGYQNTAQEALHISYSSLEDYVSTLSEAMTLAYKPYEDTGVKQDGVFKQLNTNVLQIENEYYSDIRPKRVTESGEKPIAALRDRGVEYIEVRILDINPYLSEGIDAEQMRFMDAFLLHCLFSQCPGQSDTACPEIKSNQRNVILQGRDPSLKICKGGEEISFKDGANDILAGISEVAKVLDQAHGGSAYLDSVRAQSDKVADTKLTPSGRMMEQVNAGQGFLDIVREQAVEHKAVFSKRPENTEFKHSLVESAAQSLQDQASMEADNTVSFEDYLKAYNEA